MQLIQLNQNDDPGKDNRALNRVIERNIHPIIHLCIKDAKERHSHKRFANAFFLSPFVLISQNRRGEGTERHAELE